jgi:iron complex transport system permease protein
MMKSTKTDSCPQATRKRQSTWRGQLVLLTLSICLLLLMLLSLRLGRYPVTISQVVHTLWYTPLLGVHHSASDIPWVVIEIVRLPRILAVTICGMGLALCGAAMQGVFRNPLVGPEIAGVSSGAAFGGVLAFLFAFPAFAVVLMAFAGGIVALVIALALAALAGRAQTLAFVLAGVIVGAFFGALVGLVESMADPLSRLPSMIFWLLGSFAGIGYQKLGAVAAAMLVCGTLLLALRWRINLLSLGEIDAAAIGVNIQALRWTIVVLVAVMVAAQVSVSGGVGWVGLIIPHLARMLVGPDHSKLLPASAALGGLYLLAMDDVARSVGVQELPIGLLTAVVGAPIFAFLFWKTHGKGWGRE